MKTTQLLILGVIAVIIISCSPASQDEIVIGGLHALTGFGVQFGTDEMQGALLAIEEINAQGGVNGKMLRLVSEDTQTDMTTTTTAYRKLVDVDGAHFIIGPTWGPFTQPLIPQLKEDNVLLISPSTGEEEEIYKEPNFLKTWPSDRIEIPVLYKHMLSNDVQRISAIFSIGSWEENMKQGFMTYHAATNIELVNVYDVPADLVDFRTLIEQLKRDDIDAVYIVLNSFDAAGVFMKQSFEAKFIRPVYGWSGLENHALLENYGNHLEPMIYPLPELTDRDYAFNAKFAQRYASEPLTPTAATAYDAVHMLALALQDGQDVDGVRERLLAIRDYEGASAIERFDENGWAVHDRVFNTKTIRDGEFVVLEE